MAGAEIPLPPIESAPMPKPWRVAAVGLLIGAFAAPVWISSRSVLAMLRAAVDLASAPRDVRRSAMWGTWYGVARQIARTPESTTVDIVMATPDARDVAVFAGASLAPRTCHYFQGWESWRRRDPAVFFHDRDAANDLASSVTRGDVVLFADPRLEPPLRIVRAEELPR
jgi:hypothetical protein